MKATLFAAAAFALLASPASGQTSVRAEETDCPGRGDRDRYCEAREYVLPARGALEVDAGPNGGIAVVGWDRQEIRVVATVQVHARGGDAARRLARQIDVQVGDVIRAEGPRSRWADDGQWSVSYEIHVPRETRLRLRAENGGIGMDGLAGDVDARTTNGGIALMGGAGRIRGETTNGGVRIELTGRTWRGDGVDLRSTNGGVSIRVPEGYSAELETGTVNGGVELDFPITIQGRLQRTIRTTLGEGGPLIRAMTTNGGVSVDRR